ncbi:MAG TPA: DUF5996 family protein [Caulobacteraceae bacterium]|nr:DUF5996 family protein [Caulobacteraceae bacterium]
MSVSGAWPELPPGPELRATSDTLQLWTQIVGKVMLARRPWINHSWHVTLRVSARGLITPLIPNGATTFSIEFDIVAQELVIRVSDGGERRILLQAESMAWFYGEVMEALAQLGAPTTIEPLPSELPDPIVPFPDDVKPRAYNPAVALAYWRALVQAERVFTRFRFCFLGKVSPIHLFWGGFDLAVTRFSGRPAPLHPGGFPHLPDAVTREAYSHEVSSAGFWPGSEGLEPSFYSYAYPTPDGFGSAPVEPATARFDAILGEFLLPYEAVRTAPDPDAAIMAFLQSTYAAAADLAHWDRASLECGEGQIGRPRAVG